MESIVSFNIAQSGQPVSIPNSVQVGSGSTLVLTYSINGAPLTLTITVEGIVNSTGDSVVLDSFSGNTNTTRTLNLTATYDSFAITATWTGGSSSVGVSGTAVFSGAGETFAGSVTLMTGNGSPEGTVSAPVGALFSNLTGAPGSTLYCKTSGGTTSSGWSAVA
jgi:hypothetical protein